MPHFGQLIPEFDFSRVVIGPWTDQIATYGWVVVMSGLVGIACGLVGNYLILRKMSLMGDAISHSILPGIVIAYMITRSRSPWVMAIGAVVAGILSSIIIEFIHNRSRVKEDSAIGITFSSLFAIGVVLVTIFAGRIDLDQECVLYGELGYVSLEPRLLVGSIETLPQSIARMLMACFAVVVAIVLFYKELLLTSFDAGLARILGLPVKLIHHGLNGLVSLVVVSAFEAVGAILVIAMLILPGATASLMTDRLSLRLLISMCHAVLSAALGMHLAVWLDCSMAPTVVLAGASLFCTAWAYFTLRKHFDRVADLPI